MEKEIKIQIAAFIGKKVDFFESYPTKNRFFLLRKKVFYKILYLLGLSVLPVIKKEQYKLTTGRLNETVIRQGRTGYTSNVVFNFSKEDQKLFTSSLPDLVLQHYQDIFIHGDSDFVIDIDNKCVVDDYCFNMNKRYTAYDGVLYRLRNNTAILRSRLNKVDKELKSGIIVSGKFSANYYHEVYENLIKLLVIPECDISSDVPIIVDAIVAKVDSFNKILHYLSDDLGRDIVFVGSKELFLIHNAYVISPVNKVTAHLKERNVVVNEDYIYDDIYLKAFRNRLLPNASKKRFPSKVFISRTNVNKRNFNEDEVLEVLKGYGFERVCPETMTFEEQMALFANADWIIGGSGAAFSNLLFCKPGCRILCIVDSIKYGYPIFSTLAYLANCKMLYYGNENNFDGQSDVHSDFIVDINKFLHTFQCLKNK